MPSTDYSVEGRYATYVNAVYFPPSRLAKQRRRLGRLKGKDLGLAWNGPAYDYAVIGQSQPPARRDSCAA